MNRPLIIALLAGSIGVAAPALALDAPLTFHAAMTGAQEPDGGDPQGSAMAEVTVSADRTQLCYEVHDIKSAEPAMAAHIHRGAAGVDGPVAMPLTKTADGTFKGCAAAPDWLPEALKTDMSGYYINLHTASYPKGAIRGQLGG